MRKKLGVGTLYLNPQHFINQNHDLPYPKAITSQLNY